MKQDENTKTCLGCGGTGQISFFQGESRFLLTMEECPECLGTGIQPERKKNWQQMRRKKNDEH